MLKNATILLLFLLVCAGFLLLSAKNTEKEDQANNMHKGMMVYPVPLPTKMVFAGEEVPLNKYGIRERLDRELLVNTYWQSNTLVMLKRSKRAFSVITPILAKYGVPDDMKYLAVAESGLINVTSPAGAKGIWQFMPATGKSYGLRINHQIDERLHLAKSTEAACQYLKKAHDRFGSWSLAAAAYNRGMAGVDRDLTKQMVGNYYDLHLNTETSRYLLRVLAFKQIFENPIDFGFHMENKDYYANELTTQIVVDSSVNNIAEFALSLGTNYHVIKSLNPWITSTELIIDSSSYIIKAPLR